MFDIQPLVKIFSGMSRREKLIFYSAVTVISLLLFDRIIIYPVIHKLSVLNEEIRQRESQIKNNLHILAQKDRIVAEAKGYKSFLGTLGSEEDEIRAFQKEIGGLADANSVYLIDMKPAGRKDMGHSKKYLIKLNCEAQVEQLVGFMYGIESSKSLLTIEKYQINPKSRDSSIAKCSMRIAKIIML